MRVVLVVLIALAAAAPPASGAAPEPGGRYRGSLEWRGVDCSACFVFTVANDSKEFAGYSYFNLYWHPKVPSRCTMITSLTYLEGGSSVAIDAAGYFRYTKRARGHFVRVVGRFADGGQRLVGTYRVRERRFGCRLRVRARF